MRQWWRNEHLPGIKENVAGLLNRTRQTLRRASFMTAFEVIMQVCVATIFVAVTVFVVVQIIKSLLRK